MNTTKPLRIACIGEAMVELSMAGGDGTANISFAGDTLNTAIYLKRAIGEAAEVAFISSVGSDTFSDRMIDFIASEDISTTNIARHRDRLPGLYAISTDDTGERSFSYWRDNSAAKTMFDVDIGVPFDVLKEFDVLYFSAISLAILPPETRLQFFAFLENYRSNQCGRIAFDSNYRPRLWEAREEAMSAIERAWSLTDIALPSLDDEQALFGDEGVDSVLQRLRATGIRHGALKCGADGPIAINGTVEGPTFPAAKTIVDTTAAGDSFNGAYLAELLRSGDEQKAMLSGHRQAIEVIAHSGAIL